MISLQRYKQKTANRPLLFDFFTNASKQPYAVGLKGGRLMVLAGLWDTWRSPAGERVRCFTIITPPLNALCAA